MGRLALFIFALFFATEVHAANLYWSSHTGEATLANCLSDSEVTGTSACAPDTAATITAGNTVYFVDSGPYSGVSLNPQNSGTDNEANRIVFMSAPGETAHFTNALRILKMEAGQSYVLIKDIHISNPTNSNSSRAVSIELGSNIELNNVLVDGIVGDTNFFPNTFWGLGNVWVIDSVFDCGDYTFDGEIDCLWFGNSHNILMLRSSALHGTHNALTLSSGTSLFAIIDSTISNKWHVGAATDPSGDFGIVSGSTFFNGGYLIESNPYVSQRGSYNPVLKGIGSGGRYKVYRENVFYDNDIHLNLRQFSSGSHYWFYHNTAYNAIRPAGSTRSNAGSHIWSEGGVGFQLANVRFVNNAMWKAENGRQWRLYKNGGTAASGNTIFNNLVADSEVSQWGTYEGANTTPQSMTWFNANNADWSGNLTATSGFATELDPFFVDADGTTGNSNFNLQSGSTLINSGVSLTYTVSAGVDSTSMSVEDASAFFTAGGTPWNIPSHADVVADTIYFEKTGGGFVSRLITSTNLGTNVITLAVAASWDADASVYHRAFSSDAGTSGNSTNAPDIGAYEFTASAASPSGTITFGGSGTISFGGDGVMQ